jgi:hypothetical protein
VTKDEAQQECRRLAAEHPERATHQWQPREEANGEWTVVKIALPPIDPNRTAELRG